VGAPGSEALHAVAVANKRLLDLYGRLMRNPVIKEVHHELDCRPTEPPNGIMLTIAVDAELPHGPGLVWDLDVWWHTDWGIDSSVRFVYGEDDEYVRRFPTRRATTVEDFVAELERAVEDLVAVAAESDIASYLDRLPGAASER